MQKIWIFLFLSWFSLIVKAQSNDQFVYENKVYVPYIKTVQCYNSNKEQSIPIITLNTKETISLEFDDLQSGTQDYWYTIEHCTSDWKSSNLTQLDFLDGFMEDRILEYDYAFNTTQRYTHYKLNFPNQQLKAKIPGNYLLKVYKNANQNEPVLSQRFYVMENQFGVQAEITNSLQVANRSVNQKINFSISHLGAIANPYQDIKAMVMQNFNPHTVQIFNRPSFVKPNQLIYNDITLGEFEGNNEFRKFDTRSLRFKAAGVKEITRTTMDNQIQLFQDVPRNRSAFSNDIDENGNYFIRNTDGRNDQTESDYTKINFTLLARKPTSNGDAYIVGRFNNFNLGPDNILIYDEQKGIFYTSLMLKQGLYDYQYLWVDKDKISAAPFDGSFFQTENNYQIFIYYRKPGSRFESLVGFQNISNRKIKGN